MASASLFMVEKKKNFEKELLLFWTVLVTLISMPVNQNEGQWLKPRKNFLLTNDTLSQYELVCLRVDLIESWSPTIKAVRLRIKMYRLLLISLYYSKRMYQSQNRSKSFRRFGTQLVLSLWPLCRCAPKKKKKPTSIQQTRLENISKRQRLWSTETPNLNVSLFALALYILKYWKKDKPGFKSDVRQRQKDSSCKYSVKSKVWLRETGVRGDYICAQTPLDVRSEWR